MQLAEIIESNGTGCSSSLAKQLPECGISLRALGADDDAATIKKIREEVDDDIDKWADLSHPKKNFRSKLDDAKQDHKELKNVKVVAHITNCFMYAVKRNENQPEKLAKALKYVPYHLFGRHDESGEWYKAKQL